MKPKTLAECARWIADLEFMADSYESSNFYFPEISRKFRERAEELKFEIVRMSEPTPLTPSWESIQCDGD